MIYLKYSCVTAPNSVEDLSYNQAIEKYSQYQDAKSSNSRTSTSDYFLYKKMGRLYETQLCFNENSSLFRAENIADSITFLSGTWNEWLLNLIYSNKPFIFQEDLILYETDRTENLRFKSDLFLLRFLLLKKPYKIPSSFLSRAHGIMTETDLENRFTNDKLILLVQKALSDNAST